MALEGCCEHSATLAAAVLDLCEALTDASRRYLLLGNCGAAEIVLAHLGPLCVARLVKDVATALPRAVPLLVAHAGDGGAPRGCLDDVGHLAASVFCCARRCTFSRKGARFLEARGSATKYALATVTDNALLELNVQFFDADLGGDAGRAPRLPLPTRLPGHMNDAADSLERSGARMLVGPEFDSLAGPAGGFGLRRRRRAESRRRPTVCREAVCAHAVVAALVRAAHLGDARTAFLLTASYRCRPTTGLPTTAPRPRAGRTSLT
jgi:hypothetical protein